MKEILAQSPVIPVLNFRSVDDAIHVVEILAECGISVIELTLKNPAAFAILSEMRKHFSHLTIGVGTITSTEQLHQVQYLGAQFGVSPGFLPSLVNSARIQDFPFLPGISSISEAMMAQELGIELLKLYPADIVGGIPLLQQLATVLPKLQFFPSGGIDANNKDAYLNCPNVLSVSMPSLTPHSFIQAKDWCGLREHVATLTGLITA